MSAYLLLFYTCTTFLKSLKLNASIFPYKSPTLTCIERNKFSTMGLSIHSTTSNMYQNHLPSCTWRYAVHDTSAPTAYYQDVHKCSPGTHTPALYPVYVLWLYSSTETAYNVQGPVRGRLVVRVACQRFGVSGLRREWAIMNRPKASGR